MKDELSDGSFRLKNNYNILNRHNYEPNKTNPETGQGIVALEYNTTAPIFITVHDTFWIWGLNQKAIYNTTSTLNEVFQQHHPQLFAQLLNAIAQPAIAVNPQNADAEAALI
jgi:hypothetical protein